MTSAAGDWRLPPWGRPINPAHAAAHTRHPHEPQLEREASASSALLPPIPATPSPSVRPCSEVLIVWVPLHLRPARPCGMEYFALLAVQGNWVSLALTWPAPFWDIRSTYAFARLASGAIMPSLQAHGF